jgi:hypothetical protein
VEKQYVPGQFCGKAMCARKISWRSNVRQENDLEDKYEEPTMRLGLLVEV